MRPSRGQFRWLLITLWLILLAAALYGYFFHREWLDRELKSAASVSAWAVAILYLVFGSLRGFTLIPVTTLVIAAIPLFPPVRLFILTLAGILISSASIYYFSDALRIEQTVARRHPQAVSKLKDLLHKYGFPVIIVWSFFPLVPTDLICYVCGVLKIDIKKMLLGVAIGEGLICAIYIFFGDHALRFFDLRA